MKKLTWILIFSALAQGCNDFHENLGNGYLWLQPYPDGGILFDKQRPKFSNTIVIDAHIESLSKLGDFLYIYRVPSAKNDGIDVPIFGYHIVDMNTRKIHRGLTLKELVNHAKENGTKLTYSLCNKEGSIWFCLKYILKRKVK